jgi:MFS superfamily sulfate permease-like transporter
VHKEINMKSLEIPKDGIEGLKQNWTQDAVSGFLVFLLALPLSLGIAKASEFPPAMGVLTAMIGGLFVSFFAGSQLTIKGPAAGLITICAGAVMEMGGGVEGWKLALGAIVVAALIQIVFGFFKFGALSDFFPHSVVHGMLAAIGLIIFSKQIHILLGIDPALLKGKEPIQLFEMIPDSIIHEDLRVTLIGIISLIIIFGLPLLKGRRVKKVPPPVLVLLVTIPLAWIMDFKHTEPAFDMVKIGNFWQDVTFNADFSLIGTFVFWKYVIMFLFVNSLESLLTVKAIDGLDPWKRISNPNKDLIAVGAGNALSGLLGGLPMISEVARSSANINFGGRTRWANFFHGFFLLVAMLLFIPVIEMIPNTALAALLIAVGYRLASPNEFFKTYKIGSEQLVVFIITIIVTVSSDLLVGVGAGILMKLIFHALNGVPFKNLFKAQYEYSQQGDEFFIKINGSAVFSNLIGFKKAFANIDHSKKIVVDFSDAHLLDHSFMEYLHHLEDECAIQGGSLVSIGFDRFKPFSNHPLSARKFSVDHVNRIEIKLSPRQLELRNFAENNELAYFPQRIKTAAKYKDFPIHNGHKIPFEENMLVKYGNHAKVEITDITIQQGARQSQQEWSMTIVQLSDIEIPIPDFALEPEGLFSKLFESVEGRDIDFENHPEFSKKYYLRSNNEEAVRAFFTEPILQFLENREEMHIECHRNRLVFFKKRELLQPGEILYTSKFAEEFISLISKKTVS